MRSFIFAGLSLWPLLTSGSLVKLDDRDSAIIYSPTGAWLQGGLSDEYKGTTTWTLTPFASFNFTFTGTSIEIIGTPDWSSDGGFNFKIDDGEMESGSAHGDRNPNTTFVKMEGLPNQKHTFVFMNGGPIATKFILDRIQYTTDPHKPTTTPPTGKKDPPSTLNVGALVGGIVGGLTLLGILVAAVLLIRKRRRTRAVSEPMSPTVSMLRPEPFLSQPYSYAPLSSQTNTFFPPPYSSDGHGNPSPPAPAIQPIRTRKS